MWSHYVVEGSACRRAANVELRVAAVHWVPFSKVWGDHPVHGGVVRGVVVVRHRAFEGVVEGGAEPCVLHVRP